MTITTFASNMFLSLSMSVLLITPKLQAAQQAEGSSSTKPFVGTWKETCADGEEFVVLKREHRLNPSSGKAVLKPAEVRISADVLCW